MFVGIFVFLSNPAEHAGKLKWLQANDRALELINGTNGGKITNKKNHVYLVYMLTEKLKIEIYQKIEII